MMPLPRPLITAMALSMLSAAALAGQTVAVRSLHQFPVSLSLAWPGPTPPMVDDASLGFSLGYLYELDRHVLIGAAGTWSKASMERTDTTAMDLTTYQMLAVVRLRLLRFGWSPYLDLEGGMAFYAPDDADAAPDDPWLSTPRLTYGIRVGAMVPLSSRLDLDVAIRYGATPLRVETTTRAVHVGFVYHLPGTVQH